MVASDVAAAVESSAAVPGTRISRRSVHDRPQQAPASRVTIDRPEVRNAVDGETSEALAAAFRAFETDADHDVAVLTGAGGTFCSGADLKAIAGGGRPNRVRAEGDGPMGPTRMLLSKPVIAAVEGHAVAAASSSAVLV